MTQKSKAPTQKTEQKQGNTQNNVKRRLFLSDTDHVEPGLTVASLDDKNDEIIKKRFRNK